MTSSRSAPTKSANEQTARKRCPLRDEVGVPRQPHALHITTAKALSLTADKGRSWVGSLQTQLRVREHQQHDEGRRSPAKRIDAAQAARVFGLSLEAENQENDAEGDEHEEAEGDQQSARSGVDVQRRPFDARHDHRFRPQADTQLRLSALLLWYRPFASLPDCLKPVFFTPSPPL